MSKTIKVGSDFSGVGAFNQALIRLGIQHEEVFACDMDKYARETYIHNYGEPKYYPNNVYDREIPTESLDIYMTSPPCQAFSLAGKRLGKNDKRGVLFFNSLEFIEKNKPRYFIFENVKGLLSDDNGKTFSEWLNFLGGKSVNGAPVIFPYEDSVPYHLYWKVLNAKNYGVPQNRERVFLIGIRDDDDNLFTFPPEEHLTKRLKDVLEEEVFEKYFLSNKMLKVLETHKNPIISKENPDHSGSILASYFKMGGRDQQYVRSNLEKYYLSEKMIGHLETHDRSQEFISQDTISVNCITANYAKQSSDLQYLKIKPNNSNQDAEISGDEINFNPLNSDTSNTDCNEDIIAIRQKPRGNNKGADFKISPTVTSNSFEQNNHLVQNQKIRRLTPRECFRLMDFPDTFSWICSDSQAYKQAGNSIVVGVLAKIISRLKLNQK